jgi:hypothetical protein
VLQLPNIETGIDMIAVFILKPVQIDWELDRKKNEQGM